MATRTPKPAPEDMPAEAPEELTPEEPGHIGADESAFATDEGWETVQDESPTVVIMETPGDALIGVYRGIETIEPENDEPFNRHRFTGQDGRPLAMNSSYTLDRGLAKAATGDLVRVTLAKTIPSKKGNDLKDFKVQVKR
jgi:hypothetical protein